LNPSLVRELRLFHLYRLLATSYFFLPTFMLFQAERGLTFADRLGLAGLYSATIVLVEVPTGVFADRLGRRRSMIAGAIAMVASCLVAIRANGFGSFAVAECLAALAMALSSGADSAYLHDLLHAHGRGADYRRHEGLASAAHLVGSAAACLFGGLLAAGDLALPYAATAVVAAASGVVAARLGDRRADRPPQRTSAWASDMLAALAAVARNGRLAWIVAYSAVVFILLRATIYVYQPYLEARGLGPMAIGATFAGTFLVGAAVALRTPALCARLGEQRLVWGRLAVLALSFVGLAGAGAGPWMLALLVVQAVATGMASPLTKPIMNREIADASHRAATLSVESMARRFAMGIFAPLVGLYGESDVMLLCGFVGLGGLGLLAVAARVSR
jgi:hypothetical protein